MADFIPIYKPFLPEKSKKYALKALEDGWLTNHTYNIEVEEILRDYLNAKHVLLICNGTAAMHLVSKGLQYKHPNINNIIVPNSVYVAAWNAFLFDNKYKLTQVKTDRLSWNFCINNVIEKTGANSAILAVHNLGNPVNIPMIKNFTTAPIIEDSCEAFSGTFSDKTSCGLGGLVGALSFFGNKTITSGEGGAVVTNDDDVAEYLEKLRGQGQTKTRYIHDVLGYNYRMTNVQAAILRGQIDCLPEILERKEEIWNRYTSAFNHREDVKIQQVDTGAKHSKWMFGIKFENNTTYDYKYDFFGKKGIEIRPMFYPITSQKHLLESEYVERCYDPVGEKISMNSIMLPSHPELTKEEQDRVIAAVNNLSKQCI